MFLNFQNILKVNILKQHIFNSHKKFTANK